MSKKTPRGLAQCLRSRVVIHTHGYFGGRLKHSAPGQTIVHLWHGCGYKGMTEDDTAGVFYGDCNFVTGGPYRELHSRLFDIPIRQVYNTGLPRNDVLFCHSNALHLLGIERESYSRIYLWMPTYRKAAFGHNCTDGSLAGFGIGSMAKDGYAALNKALEKSGALLIIKPHPMDSATIDNASGFSHIRCITNHELLTHGVELYELLSEADVLWSDYSSVIVDYLLLDRPIILVLSDADEYAASRGFVFEDMESYLPGPVVPDLNVLVAYIENPSALDSQYENKRRSIAHEFHEHIDGESCARVCDVLFGRKGEGGGLVDARLSKTAY